jgi:soluble lytic murein transglycosylase-like protein
MRATLAFAVLLLGLSSAAPEPEYSFFHAGDFHAAESAAGAPLIEIESSTARADRLAVGLLPPPQTSAAILKPDDDSHPTQLASADADFAPDATAATDAASDSDRGTAISLGDLCNALFTSARDNDLPVQFFANLIWQESRLRNDAVSKKGALGIAQFMPQTAVENGLDDPFDPLQAIPASARFLRELRLQFGNLGLVAAAYNAGARRVAQWLERRNSLPSETRTYVVRVTGLSVDAWRSMPIDGNALTFVEPLPCRSMPAFANIEQEQSEQAQLEEAKLAQANLEEATTKDAPMEAAQGTNAHAAADIHNPPRQRREARRVMHERRGAKREATRIPRSGREKRNSA